MQFSNLVPSLRSLERNVSLSAVAVVVVDSILPDGLSSIANSSTYYGRITSCRGTSAGRRKQYKNDNTIKRSADRRGVSIPSPLGV